jgi:hypothetical protein
MTMLEYIQL